MTRIERRDDVNPKQGVRDYGNVAFADETNNKYPIDSAEHVRAAWSYINKENYAKEYDADELRLIKRKIKDAARKHGVEIEAS